VAKGIGGDGHQQRCSCNSMMWSGKAAEEGDGRWIKDGSGGLLDDAN
jgi:hypothetical protein